MNAIIVLPGGVTGATYKTSSRKKESYKEGTEHQYCDFTLKTGAYRPDSGHSDTILFLVTFRILASHFRTVYGVAIPFFLWIVL